MDIIKYYKNYQQMEIECVKEFVKIITKQNEIDKQNILDSTINEINELISKDNNLINILVNLDEIDLSLTNISFWVKYGVYNHIFSKEAYEKILNEMLKFIFNDENVASNNGYLKYLLYGGLVCEIIKIFYYNDIIDSLIYENDTIDSLSKKAVKNAIKKTFLEEKEKVLLFIKQLFNDAKKYYSNDEIFNDITNLIKENGLESTILN